MLQSVRHAHSAKRVAMTPLIDIVFILLLFFILQSNFTQFRELLLPVPAKSEGAREGPLPLRIEVGAGGRLWIDGVTLRADGLGEFLDRRDLPGATPVVLAAAPAVPVQLLVDLCDTLRSRKLQGIDIRALEAP
ncbi:MAG: biopolymer transporter ExbD [Gammaproteobacteria bacterium]|jgi:biopolymer transport protein ExbD|nr:biopolymer transporter ExbD [Gammaproteobacteria bacterium]MBK8990302.1 biopolymer transporter ExbD [Gammaproteobacteria bacterium]MBK9469134.1 biopolymer transporter ExbD [Gammaproteobacteria bacterium]MBP6481305.1 biopolymer transporter ExbD [Pseudomonadales bacterium]MBP7910793.1 biopolymer transporter ExbD [Pseudomonadales bacterium]